MGERHAPPSGAVHASFLPAGQPDMVRAARKDEFFVQTLREQLLSLAQRLLGPRRALGMEEELSLASSLLYHGLTTGAGVPTLGEEYCSLHLVEGAAQRPLTAPRRALLLALHCLLPYLLQREQRLAASAAAFGAPPAPLPPPADEPASLAEKLARAARAARAAARAALPRLAPSLLLAQRAHLALFYLNGLYLHPSHRAVGARRVFLGRLGEPRASYRVLGALLALQVAVQARRLARERLTGGRAEAGEGGRHAVLRDGAGGQRPLDPAGEGAEEAGAAAAGAPACALCLSPRRAPTATPCGHLFCWPCALAWTATKPECPLCRAPCAPQELVQVVNLE